ncbi:MAG: hypothetical protein ACOC1O_04090 [bacterium]
MSLSISRDSNDLTPEQPSVEENIEKANEILDNYGKELEKDNVINNGEWAFLIWQYRKLGKPKKMRDKLLDIVMKFVLKQLGGGGIVEDIILDILKTIMEDTDIDDKIYEQVADHLKERIPGEDYEPIIGKVFEGLGKELQKPVE